MFTLLGPVVLYIYFYFKIALYPLKQPLKSVKWRRKIVGENMPWVVNLTLKNAIYINTSLILCNWPPSLFKICLMVNGEKFFYFSFYILYPLLQGCGSEIPNQIQIMDPDHWSPGSCLPNKFWLVLDTMCSKENKC